MANILNIETSTEVCSVALTSDGMVLEHREDYEGRNHALLLSGFIEEMMQYATPRGIKIDAVAVSIGPGSYTGLRIGVSMAKGICYALNIPLLSVSTLELMCVPVLLHHEEIEDNALLCPMIDARRMEVYAAIYDRSLKTLRPIQADVVDGDTYRQWLDERPVYFFGNGAAKCIDTIAHPNARLIEGIEPLAKWMMPLAERKMFNGTFEDVAYYVPYYLKDFVAKLPKNELIRK